MGITVTKKEKGLVYGKLGGTPREPKTRYNDDGFKARSAEEITRSINAIFYKG